MSKHYVLFFIDVLIVFSAFLLCVWIKPGSNKDYLSNYLIQFFMFVIIWIVSSVFFKKYASVYLAENNMEILRNIILSNVFSFAIVTSIMYVSRILHFSRTIVVGTTGVASIIEIMLSSIYFSIVKAAYAESQQETDVRPEERGIFTGETGTRIRRRNKRENDFLVRNREKTLLVELSPEAYHFIFSYARIESPETLIISTTSRFNIDLQLGTHFESIVNIERINDVRYINKFFESANVKLADDGLFISYVETKDLRKKRILKKYPPVLNYIIYSFDFIVKRIFPKFYLTKKIYFFLTRGQNRVISKAEVFGRLYSCGFEVITEKLIGSNLYFVARKVKTPLYPEKPSYGPLIKLQRVGKNGKLISVYKMRTMHPFAEYLQEYVYEKVGLDHGGKFKNDFRVTTIGKIMRMFWIDELPMIINLFKGELKIVGVRPLSQHYFNLYTKELQQKRIKTKPGLIPPFYVDFPKTLDEIMASELKYISSYEKRPFFTDLKYFSYAFFNIVFKKYRSK